MTVHTVGLCYWTVSHNAVILQRMCGGYCCFCSFLRGAGEGVRKLLMGLFERAFLGLTKAKFDLSCHWKEVDGKLLLEAVEPWQSPITRHPDTGEVTWVCNLHNHSRYLRSRFEPWRPQYYCACRVKSPMLCKYHSYMRVVLPY